MNNSLSRRTANGLAVLALAAIATGCVQLKSPTSPALSAGPAPTGWSATNAVADRVQDNWLAAFGDAQLANLVSEALTNNPDLAATAAKLAEATASAKVSSADLWPSLSASGSGQNSSRLKRTTEEKNGGVKSDTSTFGASLDLSWEVDVWGRLRYARRSATKTAAASAQDYAAARKSLAAQVAKAWFAAVEAQLQAKLTDEFVSSYEDTLHLVEVRFQAGAVTEQDVANARADLASSRQQAEAATTTARSAVRSLELLLGRYPATELQVATDLSAMPPAIPAGVPADLLARRADLLAASKRVNAAFDNTQAAAAARLPKLSLTSSLGTSSAELKNVLDPKNAALTLAGNLAAPLFDGGRLKAQSQLAQAQQREALAGYRSTVLAAFGEVENYLESETALAREEIQLREAATQYETARRIAETRYQAGSISLTDVLTIQRQELQSKSGLLAMRNNRLATRVNLHLALGGDF